MLQNLKESNEKNIRVDPYNLSLQGRTFLSIIGNNSETKNYWQKLLVRNLLHLNGAIECSGGDIEAE